MSLRTRLVASITAVQSAPLGTSTGTASARVEQTTIVDIPSGTTEGKADSVYRSEFTLVGDNSQPFDLMSLVDPFGVTFAFTNVKAFKLEVPSCDDGVSLSISGDFNPNSTVADSAADALTEGDVILVHRLLGQTVNASNNNLVISSVGDGTVTAVLTLVGVRA